MNATRLLVAGVLVSLLGGISLADDKVDYAKLLIGKWEVTKSDPDTVPPGAVVEFTKDGKIKLAAKKDDKDFTMEGTYKVEKNTFTMIAKMGDQEHKQTITITKISDKAMTTKDERDKVVELKRKK